MSKPKRRSLAEVAQAHRSMIRGCWVCTIPERAEVDAGLAKGYSQKAILIWLREDCGYGVATKHRVQAHASDCHNQPRKGA